MGNPKEYEWFSFESTDADEDADAGAADPLLDLEVRISPYPVSRSITVAYMNWQEMLSEMGASYTFALGASIMFALALKYLHVFWKRSFKEYGARWLGEPLTK